MRGLPEAFDAETFVGCELELVIFASNVIFLKLGEENSVTVLDRVRYRTSSGGGFRDDVIPVADSSLPALIGRVIERAEVRLSGNLVLHFAGGGMISIDDRDEHYESYALSTPEGETFV
jgi:hypothetical protein